MTTKRKAGADTVAKQPKKPNPIPNSKPFTKGDARINRNGRPRNFDALRELVKDIAAEKLQGADLTRVEAMILSMSSSRNPNDKRLFLEYGYGKVKEEIEIDDKSLTDDERAARIAQILDAARARRNRQTIDGSDTPSEAAVVDVPGQESTTASGD
jgi:hypothetical protein